MRKLILLHHVSLDGLVSGPSGELDWVAHDDEMWNEVTDLLSSADTAVFGRVTYQMFESYWPAAARNPSSSQNELDFARWIEDTPKIVLSKTLERVDWKNTRLVRQDIVGEIARTKEQPGKNMLVFGGPMLDSALMKFGLIDEYRFMVNPVVLGRGKPLFTGLNDRHKLRLVKTRTFGSGVVGLHYQKARR